MEDVSRLLLIHVVAPLLKAHATEAVMDLASDGEGDQGGSPNACGRCGKHVAYAGYFKDASVGNTLQCVVPWAHNSVMGCVTLRPRRWPNWVMGLPVLFALYRKRPDCDRGHPFLTRQQIVAAMIRQVHEALPDKLLIIRDPTGQQKEDFAFCTDPTVDDTQIVERFAARWPIEETIHDGKQRGGFEQVQGWCPRTVERQAPMALVVQTLVKAWYLHYGVRAASARPQGADWMPSKDHPSYLDMLATRRRVLWDHRINHNSTLGGRLRGIWKTLQCTLCAAA